VYNFECKAPDGDSLFVIEALLDERTIESRKDAWAVKYGWYRKEFEKLGGH